MREKQTMWAIHRPPTSKRTDPNPCQRKSTIPTTKRIRGSLVQSLMSDHGPGKLQVSCFNMKQFYEDFYSSRTKTNQGTLQIYCVGGL